MIKLYFLATIVQLQVFFVTINAEEINLIQSIKTEVSTSMSSLSTWNIPHTSWNSSNVIDNKATGNPNTCGCCAGTAGTESPWLQIDLGSVYSIIKIQITGRSGSPEQYQAIYVYVSNTSITNSNGSLIYTGNTTAGTRFKIYQHPPSSFRYLFIRRFYKSFLTICEVELFEPGIDILDHIRDKALTFQSNIFGGNINNASYGPYKAIDNKANYSIDTCKCCSVTTDGPSWWQIDLRKRYSVNRLLIFGRSDLNHSNQLVGANVFAGNTSLEQDGRLQKPIFTVPNITTSTQFDHWLDEPVTAQFFIIKLNTLLTLCEFILYGTECSNGSYGQLCSERCHCADNMSCNFWTGKCQTPGCLPGWTGSACNKGVINILDHIRHDVVTSQSSLFNSNNISYGSYNAIDGKADYAIDTCQCCSVTNERNSWWQVDLRKQYLISRLDIFGRNDLEHNTQLQGAVVYAGNTSLINVVNANQKVFTVPNITTSTHIEKHLNKPLTAQFFIMKLNALLTLCEFIVYGKEPKCDIGKFGQLCFEKCHCLDAKSCNVWTGNCQAPGCLPGWIGPACDTECETGRYGNKCNNTCGKCANVLTCNNENGTCPTGCIDGFYNMDKLCKTPCREGSYGQDCAEKCGHCAQNSTCNITTGYCQDGCSSGYSGRLCTTKCSNHTFGPNCVNPCHCTNTSQCDIFNGNCSDGCDLGWTGFNCSLACGHQQFGKDCKYQCHCFGNEPCAKDSGICPSQRCEPGWELSNCSKECDTGRYGYECNSTCGKCADVLTCNNANGTCPRGCMDGYNYTDTLCKTPCTEGFYGHNCAEKCGHCAHHSACIITTGDCQDGCSSGYSGRLCKTKCSNHTFGPNCVNPCHCTTNTTQCDIFNGNCSDGCGLGWTGFNCSLACGHQHFGPDCTYQCHCFGNRSCAKDSGMCPSQRCEPGWELSNCSKACNFPHFGDNCVDICNCLNNSRCNHVYGSCDNNLCAPGWQGESCNHACNFPQFGDNCNYTCHCLNNSGCNHIDGRCDVNVCESGWHGKSCDRVCEHRSFGNNCSSHCNCLKNSSCEPVTGNCYSDVCDPGWKGSSCDQACDFPYFGDNCNYTCHCLNNTKCDYIDGSCNNNLCDAGWRGDSCNDACNGSFGYNCSNKCHCDSYATCNPTDGQCPQGKCQKGWQGENCSIEIVSLSEEKSSSATAAVAGGVSAAVIFISIGVIIGFILFKKRNASNERKSKQYAYKETKTHQKETRKSTLYEIDNTSFDDIAETNMNEPVSNDYYSFGDCSGIKIHELWDYIYRKMENKCEQFYKEFKTLPYGLVHSYKAADKITNRGKNRYREMYAYDHTRVILSGVEDGKNTDYINACYIDGYEKVKKFVASQGPTKQMIDDFWRMVWQLKSDKIVMLTNLIEMGTTKCMQYWPNEDEGNECTFDNMIVKLLNTETFLDYNIRHLEVRMNDEPRRRIRQFHFKSWPDKDVPDSTWCLVNFWRVVDTSAISKAGPIVVHCSAGVGRTGTFIGLDNMVNQARVEGFVRPLQVVQTLRQQRVNMVQTKEQYVYLHEAVADAMLFGTHIVWTKQFGDVLSFMTQNEKNNTRTRLQIQFELIEESVVNSTSEVSESPEYSNVETLLSESDAYRPKLKNRGSKFIQQLRAMFIPNYKGKSTFLVSMSPDKDTMEEFWSLVDDNNIKTVIMLTEQSSSCYQSSCDLGSSPKGGSIFSVNKIEEKIRKGYTQRTFTFKESGREEEDYLTTVKQFEYTAWKDGYPSPGDTTSFLDMIEAVLKWQPHLSESQPILVFCGDGCTRSGIVCVLMNELQRIKYEGGHVNIVESVKMIKKRQRHLIGSYEQYKFCFDLMMDHIKRTDVYQNL